MDREQRPSNPVCAAPATALYFRPDGYVTTCCGSWHVLGRVTGENRRSLRQIWRGAQAAELREAVASGDYSLGCWECGNHAAGGRRDASLAAEFDRFAPTLDAEFPQLIDFAMSNRCNLQCVMCNGGLSSAIRRHREHRPPLPAAYDDRFFDELDEFLPTLRRAQFKGGEPFLAPENRRVWDRLVAMGGDTEVCVTTNATVWNDRVEHYVRSLAMDVIASVDAVDPEIIERTRVGVDATALWSNIERFRTATDSVGASLTLCMCIMSTTWSELGEFLRRVDGLGAEPSVIWVDGPARFNLLSSGREHLEEVAAGLAMQLTEFDDLSPASSTILLDAVHRIQNAVEREASQVTISRRRTSDDETVQVRELLGVAAGTELLVLHYDNEVIDSVEAPSWSLPLSPQEWVGGGLEQTMTLIAESSPGSMRSSVTSLSEGVHRLVLHLGETDGMTLVGIYAPPRPGSSRSSLVLTKSGDGSPQLDDPGVR